MSLKLMIPLNVYFVFFLFLWIEVTQAKTSHPQKTFSTLGARLNYFNENYRNTSVTNSFFKENRNPTLFHPQSDKPEELDDLSDLVSFIKENHPSRSEFSPQIYPKYDELSDLIDTIDSLHTKPENYKPETYVPDNDEHQHPTPHPHPRPHQHQHDQVTHPHASHFDGYRKIWHLILEELYRITKDKSILHDSVFAEGMLNQLFYLLEDVKVMTDHSEVLFCPKSFQKVGKVCLTTQFLQEFLDFHESRLYCQVVFGGDLAIFRNANEFADIQTYIASIDPEKKHSYFIGLTDEDRENDWRFIDGRTSFQGAPFWGRAIAHCDHWLDPLCRKSRHVIGTRDFGSIDSEIQPEPNNPDENYAILLNADHYYIHGGSLTEAEAWHTLPLCQYVPERDQKNLQYGEAVADLWSQPKEPWSSEKDHLRTQGQHPAPHYHANPSIPQFYDHVMQMTKK